MIMAINEQASPQSFTQFSREGSTRVQANIAVEAPVSLTVNGEIWLTFQCTPIDLEALAVGFLFNEGYLHRLDDIANVHVCDQKDNVDVWLNHAVTKPSTWRRTSGCHGGATTAEFRNDSMEPVTSIMSLTPNQVFDLTETFLDIQTPHAQSGGVHTSALSAHGKFLLLLHDIGRHNTLDKIAGRMVLDSMNIADPILFTSGRISADMLQKAARMRSPVLISMRSISQMGRALAENWNITTIGGARPGRFNLYTHPERITTVS